MTESILVNRFFVRSVGWWNEYLITPVQTLVEAEEYLSQTTLGLYSFTDVKYKENIAIVDRWSDFI